MASMRSVTYAAIFIAITFFGRVHCDGICYQCDSSTDPNCIENVEKVPSELPCSTSCFTRAAADGTVTRGCLAAADDDSCTEDDNCMKCPALPNSPCNRHLICKICNSSNGPNCTQTNATQAAFNGVCHLTESRCYVFWSPTYLSRECGLRSCQSDTCSTCTGANCNTGIYPADRRRCYQCTGPECADVTAATSFACLNYAKDDQCYWYGNAETNMTRGCLSDGDDSANHCRTGLAGYDVAPKCRLCATDNCNDGHYMTKQTLQCVKCSDAANCPLAQAANQSVACTNAIVYSDDEACYMQNSNGRTSRGCLYDRNVTAVGACTAANNCGTCSGLNGCNSAANNFTCIRCRSDEDSLCYNDADQLAGSACTNTVADPREEQCYHGEWYDVVTRGCLVDVDDRMYTDCGSSDNDACSTCDGPNCNTARSGAAVTATVTIGIWSAIVMLLKGGSH